MGMKPIVPHGWDDLLHGLEVIIAEPQNTDAVRVMIEDLIPLMTATAVQDFVGMLRASSRPDAVALKMAFAKVMADCAQHTGEHNQAIAQKHKKSVERKKAGVSRSTNRQERLASEQQRYNQFWGVIMFVEGISNTPSRYGSYVNRLYPVKLSRRDRQLLHENLKPSIDESMIPDEYPKHANMLTATNAAYWKQHFKEVL